MIIIGIVLSVVDLVYLCWLLFALAVYALPFFVGTAVALVAYQNGSGPMAAIVIGAIASNVALVAARVAFTTLRSPFVRAVIASVFAIPAALAGYHAALGLAHIGAATNGWQQAIAIICGYRRGHGLVTHDALYPARTRTRDRGRPDTVRPPGVGAQRPLS
jgi:hypothetical protein